MAYTNLRDLFTGICDAIRAKKGTTGSINHQDIPSEIGAILSPADGSIPTKTQGDLTVSNYTTVIAPAGYYANNVSKTISDSNLVASNIKSGTSIFGVTGTLESGASGIWQVCNVGATYGFEKTSDGYYTSTNAGVKSSASLCKVKLRILKSTTIVFDCINYAESNYDYGMIGATDVVLDDTYSASEYSDTTKIQKSFRDLQSASVQQYSLSLSAGDYEIYMKYVKDSSTDSNNDSFKFKISSGADEFMEGDAVSVFTGYAVSYGAYQQTIDIGFSKTPSYIAGHLPDGLNTSGDYTHYITDLLIKGNAMYLTMVYEYNDEHYTAKMVEGEGYTLSMNGTELTITIASNAIEQLYSFCHTSSGNTVGLMGDESLAFPSNSFDYIIL